MPPAPYSSHYASSKYALEGYLESLDYEIRDYNVRVSLIEPGTVKGSFDHHSLDPDAKKPEHEAGRAWIQAFYNTIISVAETPEDVGKAVLRAATATRPKLHYTVGKSRGRLGDTSEYGRQGLVLAIPHARLVRFRPGHLPGRITDGVVLFRPNAKRWAWECGQSSSGQPQ